MLDSRLLALLPKVRWSIVACVAARWLALLCQVVLYGWIGAMISSLVAGSSAGVFEPLLAGSVWVPIVCVIALAILQAVAKWCGDHAGAAAGATLGAMVFARVVELGPARARVIGDSEVVTLMGEGLEMLRPYFGKYVPQFIYGMLAPVTLFVVLAAFDLPVAIVLLVCVPLMPASIMILMTRAKKFLGAYWGTYVDLGAAFLDAVRGLTTLKVFGTDAQAHERLDAQAEEFRAITMKLLRVQLQSVTFMDLFTYGGIAVGCLVACWQVAQGALRLGDAVTIVLLARGFFMPMRTFGSYFHTGMNAKPVIEQVHTLMDAEVPPAGDESILGAQITIEGSNLAFSYEGSPQVEESQVADTPQVVGAGQGSMPQAGGAGQASNGDGQQVDASQGDGAGQDVAARHQLDGINFTIRPNSFIGITGPSGSGKSTLAALLAGDLVGYEGSLRINGVELRDASPRAIHETVTLVSRASHVFRGSFRSNLAIASPNVSDGAMWDALRRARLADFVFESGGLDAPVEAGGANLSGGQRQRLVFARALLRNTPVYVFDEATANIDAESERYLLAAIQKIALSKTVIVISHRLPVLRYADEILVMNGGCVAERGAHQELMAAGGLYRSLWDKNAELEVFAASVVDELPDEKPDVVEEALASMPGMMAGVMRAFMGIVEAERYQSAGGSDLPEGHPAWIPLPRYRAGMSSRSASPEGEGAESAGSGLEGFAPVGASIGASESDGAAQEASGDGDLPLSRDVNFQMLGFMGLADATANGEENAAIKEAMGQIRNAMQRPREVRVTVDPLPPAHRSVFAIVGKCAKLTSGLVPRLLLAVALGCLGWLLTCGIFVFAMLGIVQVCGVAGAGAVMGAGANAGAGAGAAALGISPLACMIGVVACAVARGPVHYAERLLTHDCTFGTVSTIRSRVFGVLRELAPAKGEGRDAGDLISLLTSDIEILEGFYSRALVPVAAAALFAVVCVVAAACVNWPVALVMAAFYLVVGVVLTAIALRATRERGAELRAYAVLMTGFLLDSLRGMRDLLAFGRAQEYADELEDRLDSMSSGEDGHARLVALLSALPQVFSLVGAIVLAFVCAYQVSCGALQAFWAIPLVAGYIASTEALCSVANLGTSFHQVLAAADRILDVMEERPVVEEAAAPVPLTGFEGLSFEGVTFTYGDGTTAISDATFAIEPGTFVGITGKSGVGKTTLLKLAMRFWDVGEGTVRMNGVDVRDASLSDLRANVNYMVQDTYLFEGTLRENLQVARWDTTDDQLEDALEKVALLDVVKAWPQGLDTVLGAGVGVSDGERQRIGLARAFLHDAPLFLLDEPTSNLDALNEAAILRSLCLHAEGKAVVIVSHRRAVAAIVDKLLEVE